MGGIAPGIKEGGELGEELQLVSYGSRIWFLVYSLTSSIVRGSMVLLVSYRLQRIGEIKDVEEQLADIAGVKRNMASGYSVHKPLHIKYYSLQL